MARSAGKKSVKFSSNPSAVTATPSKTAIAGPPPPFTLPDDSFAKSFLSDLPSSHIYILHVDKTPAVLKRRVFLVPVYMNVFIVLGILVRAYYALPQYGALLLATFGDTESPAKIDTSTAGYGHLFEALVGRTMLFLFDYALISFLGSWPWSFVLGLEKTRYASPVSWRRTLWAKGGSAFLENEVIVRVSRKWDGALLPNWTMDDELTVKQKIMPAVDKNYLEKTGYLLMDKHWDLDFEAMAKAHELIADGKLSFADFDKAVLVYYPPSKGPAGGWMIWHVHKEDAPKTVQQRDNLVKFKDKLTTMGHEDLFYRWVELVQYESSMPGGFTPDRQASAMREAKRMFEAKGVDFAKFWEEVDGQKGMPGLE